MAMEQELANILLPAKKAEAEFNIKKLSYDSQLLEKIYNTKSAALDASYRGITAAVSGGGQQSGSATTATPASTSGGYQSRFGFGSKLAPPQSATPTTKPSWRVVSTP
jgi:hypothetical protein